MEYNVSDINPMISVIVPVYGTEQYLPKCIDSIIQQSYSNIEIILVDDQSPDSCPEICDCYSEKDKRIIVIHQKNKGVSGARNTGIRCSSGEYIMFVDSDDELYPDSIKLLYDEIKSTGADIASGKKQSASYDKQSVIEQNTGKRSVYCGEEPVFLSLDGDVNTNSTCAKLFNKSFIDGIYFEEGKNVHEDGFFLFLCYLKKPVLVQRDVYIYRYNFRQNSNSHSDFSDKYLAILYFCEQKKKIISESYPQYIDRLHNMEVRTNLQFLDLLCRTKDNSYNVLQKKCINTVRALYKYHRPINKHHKQLVWIVVHNLYPLYKKLVYYKNHR